MAAHQCYQPSSSIYLTFKVLRLLNQLRRRLRPRVSLERSSGSLFSSETSLGIQTSLSKTVSRVSGLRNGKQLHQASNRVCKSRKCIRPALKLQTDARTSAKIDAADPNTPGDSVKHVLQSLDGNASAPDSALSAIASDDKLFLQQQNITPHFEASSLREIVSHLLLVQDAIDVLFQARSEYDDEWLVSQGSNIGLNIDETFIANYEHLLLRLRSLLVEALGKKVLEALLEGGHDKKQRKLLQWFSEFPGCQRPLTTSTMPWSIKPSLAVLWGVCWMFYDSADRANSNRIPRNRFLTDQQFQWNAPQPTDYYNFGQSLISLPSGAPPQLQTQQHSGEDVGGVRGDGDLRPEDFPPEALICQAARAQPQQAALSSDLQQGLGLGSVGPEYNTRAFANAAGYQWQDSLILPHNSGTHDLLAFSQHHLNVDSLNEPWQLQFPQHTSVASHLPQRPRSTGHLTVPVPGIRVSDDGSNQATVNQGFAQPHPDFDFSLYQHNSSQLPQVPQLNLNTNLEAPSYTMGTTIQTSPIQIAPGTIRHDRTPSIPNSTMPTPVSISAPISPLRSPMDDRRQSVASSIGHRRQDSDLSSQDEESGLSPRRNHSYKRAEEPPRNREGKMMCKHSECLNITFERKCEWSKHMDKHDRPYKCNVKGCEKLQGFTYSGGLLRHEREVHKMHGGTKKSLFCPFPDCKRSSGSGFTRKENLAEHVRRVHRRTSTSSDLGNLIITRSETQDDDIRLSPGSPYQRPFLETHEEHQLAAKRKRSITEEGDEIDWKFEAKRLRKENEDIKRDYKEQNERLKQLELSVMSLQRAHQQ